MVSIDSYQNNIINNIIDEMKKEKNFNRVKSIIITGSLGRREPTYQIINDKIKLKSDIEIAVVYVGSEKQIRKIFDSVKRRFEEDINFMPISVHRIKNAHNYNFTLLPSIKKTIFTYDLYNGSYTAYGEKYIDDKKIELKQVDIYEAKRIIANRIAEYYYLTQSCKDEYLRLQWKSKIVLAVASAILISKSCYASSYKKQYENIYKLRNYISEEFLTLYEKAYKFLRENGKIYNIKDEELRQIVANVYNEFNYKNLKKSLVKSSSRKIKYLIRYIGKYGHKIKRVLNIENFILDGVINSYINNNEPEIWVDLWHNVIY